MADHQNTDLTEKLDQVRARVRNAEQTYGRTPGSVQILPVSKTRPAKDILCLTKAGCTDFGESYLQEAQNKIRDLPDTGIQWHFIGPIQSNKTQALASHFSWVHSVDREKIAQRLNEQRPENLPPLNICIQINISGEKSKSGVSPSELKSLVSNMSRYPRLHLRGLMAIPAPDPEFERQRAAFRAVHKIFDDINAESGDFEMDTLSMGMSNDLEAAIAEGSTMVRIGTDIFGPRENLAEKS